MPDNKGLAGTYSGMIGNELVVLGGANFPKGYPWEGGTKKFWKTLYSYHFDSQEWEVIDDFLPSALAYGISIQLPDGLLCIGGCNQEKCSDKVFLIQRKKTFSVDTISYPSLPVSLANAAGVLLDNKIYVAGGQESVFNEKSAFHFFVLDLGQKQKKWQILPCWPGASRGFSVCVALGKKIYLFSGRSYAPDKPITVLADGYVFNPQTSEWSILNGDYPVMAGKAITYQDKYILFLGGVEEILPTTSGHPGFSHIVRVLDVETGVQFTSIVSQFDLPVTTNIVSDGNLFYITSGEIRPGVRTPSLLKGQILDK